MGFPKPNPPIDQQGIVNLTQIFRYGLTSGMGELVGISDDEIFKRVLGIQKGVFFHLFFLRSDRKRNLGGCFLADDERNLKRGIGEMLAKKVQKRRQEFLLDFFPVERVGNFDDDLVLFLCPAM